MRVFPEQFTVKTQQSCKRKGYRGPLGYIFCLNDLGQNKCRPITAASHIVLMLVELRAFKM